MIGLIGISIVIQIGDNMNIQNITNDIVAFHKYEDNEETTIIKKILSSVLEEFLPLVKQKCAENGVGIGYLPRFVSQLTMLQRIWFRYEIKNVLKEKNLLKDLEKLDLTPDNILTIILEYVESRSSEQIVYLLGDDS